MTDYEKTRDAAAEEIAKNWPWAKDECFVAAKKCADWANQRAEADGHSPQFWKRSYDAANQRAETLESDNARLADEAEHWKRSHKTLQDAANGRLAEQEKELAELKEMLNRSYEKREKLTDDFYRETEKLRAELNRMEKFDYYKTTSDHLAEVVIDKDAEIISLRARVKELEDQLEKK